MIALIARRLSIWQEMEMQKEKSEEAFDFF